MRKSHQKLKLTEARRGPIKVYVDSTGIRYCGDKFEVRLQWRAIDAVENLNAWVLFRFEHTGLYIPSRVFADDAERFAFLAVAAAHVKAAAKGAGA